MQSEDNNKNAVPFQHMIKLHGPQGEIIQLKSTFDDGAMVNAVDLKSFQKIQHRLKPLEWSTHTINRNLEWKSHSWEYCTPWNL
jgi:hypothetical protein